MGYTADKILLPKHSQTIEVYPDIVKLGPALPIRKIMVDGLGVGDVGNVVLRDRQMLAKEGMVVAVIEVDQNDLSKITNIELISRGFVFTKEAGDLLNHGAQEVTKAVATRKDKIDSDRVVKSIAVDILEKFFFHKTARRPMILPVVVEV
jgi:ribonuclease J